MAATTAGAAALRCEHVVERGGGEESLGLGIELLELRVARGREEAGPAVGSSIFAGSGGWAERGQLHHVEGELADLGGDTKETSA